MVEDLVLYWRYIGEYNCYGLVKRFPRHALNIDSKCCFPDVCSLVVVPGSNTVTDDSDMHDHTTPIGTNGRTNEL